jgi:Rod binding domain-containing protein
VDEIFDRAGMEVTWLNCSTSQGIPAEDGCNRFEGSGHLALRIMLHSFRSHNEVFGGAFLSSEGAGCYSDVYYDRAMKLHTDWSVGLSDILGNVMAHELGHLLLGSNSHSSAGIMRAHWRGEDLRSLSWGNLWFTNEQADHMREKLLAAVPERSIQMAASMRAAF